MHVGSVQSTVCSHVNAGFSVYSLGVSLAKQCSAHRGACGGGRALVTGDLRLCTVGPACSKVHPHRKWVVLLCWGCGALTSLCVVLVWTSGMFPVVSLE